MSIAIDPILKGYHPANRGYADLATVTQESLADSRDTVDSQASIRVTAAGLQFLGTLSVVAVSGASLAWAGWLFVDFLVSLATQLESLDTMQLLHALAGV